MMARRHTLRVTLVMGLGLLCCVTTLAQNNGAHAAGTPASGAQNPPAQTNQIAENGTGNADQPAIVLDHVIAIINGDVLLDSDVQEEIRFAALQPFSVPQGQNTRQRATERIINRTLILQQMKEQQQLAPVTDAELKQNLDDLRKQIPACGRYHCSTQQGWDSFLHDNGLMEAEVEQRWRQRLEILRFIGVRFRAGIRIPKSDIQQYYEKTLVPAFNKENQKTPSVDSLTPRIEEILLQQHVNVLLQDWLKSLRDQGTVQILDSAYGKSTDANEDDNGGAE
jgi:peptidyl-prolyl cis-trans isomerase SurA